MTEEKKEKKITALQRKKVELNLAGVEADISDFKKVIAIHEKMIPIRLEHYTPTEDAKPTMKYQADAAHISLAKQLDEIRWNAEVRKMKGQLLELEERAKEYREILKERA